ncbi:hypothetical protein [Paenibacillus albilobatus]|nr:hypothetical protein [Paenibacillus albilobatus]
MMMSLTAVLSIQATSAFAAVTNDNDDASIVSYDILNDSDVNAKQALAFKFSNEFNPNLSEDQKKELRSELGSILAELVSQGASEETIDKEIQKYNAHVLFQPQTNEDQVVSPMSQGSDIQMNKPTIVYSATSKEWIVTGGGYWKTENWKNDVPGVWLPITGETKNIGGRDSVGITFFNKSGTYNAKVLSSSGYLMNGRGQEIKNDNPTYGNGNVGVAFEIQDYAKLADAGTADVYYMGHNFAAQIVYDENFKNLHGNARTFYVHTWDNSSINNIQMGASGGTFGVTFSIANESKSFKIFNNADASF